MTGFRKITVSDGNQPPAVPQAPHVMHCTFARCGHTVTTTFDWDRSGIVEQQTLEAQCDACREAQAATEPEALWVRGGYNSPEAYEAAVAHDRAVAQVERERAAYLERLAALPESERPFTTRAPMRGEQTLDQLAARVDEQ